MASVLATERLTNCKRTQDEIDSRIRPLTLVAVRDALQARTHRTIRRDRLERDDRAYRWAVRRAHAEGSSSFRSTYTQAARGMGYPTTGDRRADFNSWSKHVWRALNSLQDAGLINWGGVKRSNGQWWCIEVHVLENATQRSIITDKSTRTGTAGLHNTGRRHPGRKPLGEESRRRPWRAASSARRIFF